MVDFEKPMFQGLACHFELFFGLLTIPKCDLGEVEKSIIQVVVRHSELIFSLLTTTKFGLCEFKKAIFQVVQGTANSFCASRVAQKAIWMKPKSDVSSDQMEI